MALGRGTRRFRTRRRLAAGRWWWGAAATLLTLMAALHWVELRVRPMVAATARSVAVSAGTTAVTEAVTAAVLANADGPSVLHVEREQDGVQVARVDVGTLTALEAAATERADAALRSMSAQTLRIPAGQLAGSVLFSGAGPAVPVRLRLIGAVHTSLVADVKSAGVNQSVHTFYLDVTAQVEVVAPLVSEPAVLHARVPVAYLVFIGDVPRMWWPGSAPSSTSVDPGSHVR